MSAPRPAWIAWDEQTREGYCVRCGASLHALRETETTRDATERTYVQHGKCTRDQADLDEKERQTKEARRKSLALRGLDENGQPLPPVEKSRIVSLSTGIVPVAQMPSMLGSGLATGYKKEIVTSPPPPGGYKPVYGIKSGPGQQYAHTLDGIDDVPPIGLSFPVPRQGVSGDYQLGFAAGFDAGLAKAQPRPLQPVQSAWPDAPVTKVRKAQMLSTRKVTLAPRGEQHCIEIRNGSRSWRPLRLFVRRELGDLFDLNDLRSDDRPYAAEVFGRLLARENGYELPDRGFSDGFSALSMTIISRCEHQFDMTILCEAEERYQEPQG